MQVENGFAYAAGEGGDHLKAVKADEVGLLGVILHKAHSPTMLLGPALGSRRHRHVQLNNCGGQCLGGESGVQWSLGGGNQGSGNQTWSSIAHGCCGPEGRAATREKVNTHEDLPGIDEWG